MINMIFPSSPYPLKNFNKRAILDMIRFAPGGVSRADLARSMDLTRSAVTSIVNDMIAEGLVRESESDNEHSSSGRRPILLEINPRRAHAVGVDMGATHLGLLLTDFSAHVIDEIELPFDIASPPETCLKEVDRQVRRLLAHHDLNLNDVQVIGVGVPGPINIVLGGVSAPPIMPGWDSFPIRSYLENLWGITVVLGNDAEFGALGEWAYGSGRGERNLAYIKVGSGIGAGLLLDGRIYRGATGCAGEIGHVTILENGPICSCGNHGCLESLAGGYAVARSARDAVRTGRRTLLASIPENEEITSRHVADAARKGDLVAQQIVSASGAYLGLAIAGLVNLFNPGMIVVGGGVSQMGDLLLDPIRQAVRDRSLRPSAQAVRVSAAVLGRRSTSMGAVVQAITLALDDLVEQSFNPVISGETK